MKISEHIAIYVHDNVDREWLLGEITGGHLFDFSKDLQELHGEIFSNVLLQRFIEEEIKHGHFEIETLNHNPLVTSSSGEQRKALLNHILSKKPAYIVLDNMYDSLDSAAREFTLAIMEAAAANTILIQVLSRKDDCLPFINTVYSITGYSIRAKQNKAEFLGSLAAAHHFNGAIPPPLKQYAAEKNPLVKMSEISVEFHGRKILQNITWQINAGEFWQLTGPNGSGKSTLVSLVTGDSPKGYGQQLELFGKQKGSGETVWDIKEKIGYFTPTMIQQFERQDSVERMVIGGLYDSVGLYIKPTERQVKLAYEWLKLIGLSGGRNKPFRLLPSGMQRMILIIRAMIKHPPLLILDEPTSGLDDDSAATFVAFINKIASETTTAIVYISHRSESGLSPSAVYELLPSATGSVGKVKYIMG